MFSTEWNKRLFYVLWASVAFVYYKYSKGTVLCYLLAINTGSKHTVLHVLDAPTPDLNDLVVNKLLQNIKK